jgi:hypothetical protein
MTLSVIDLFLTFSIDYTQNNDARQMTLSIIVLTGHPESTTLSIDAQHNDNRHKDIQRIVMLSVAFFFIQCCESMY